MRKTIIIILIVVIITIGVLSLNNNHTRVLSKIDNNYYYVLDLEDKQKASDLLGTINLKIKKTIECLVDNTKEDNEFHKYIIRLKNNYNGYYLTEDTVSYSINKRNIHLCLRQTDGSFINENTILYVVLHELTHLASPNFVTGRDHSTDPIFSKLFDYIIEKAIDCKYNDTSIYNYVDFYSEPAEYCGMTIRTT